MKFYPHDNAELLLVIAIQSIFSELTKILGTLFIAPAAHTDMRNNCYYNIPSELFLYSVPICI